MVKKTGFALKTVSRKTNWGHPQIIFFTDLTFPDQPLKICPSQKNVIMSFEKKI